MSKMHDPFGDFTPRERDSAHAEGGVSIWAWSVWLAAVVGAATIITGWITLIVKLTAQALQ